MSLLDPYLSPLLTLLQTWWTTLTTGRSNLHLSVSEFTILDYYRLISLSASYVILRPDLERLFRKLIEMGKRKEEEGVEMDEEAVRIFASIRRLRGEVVEEEDEDEESEGEGDDDAGHAGEEFAGSSAS